MRVCVCGVCVCINDRKVVYGELNFLRCWQAEAEARKRNREYQDEQEQQQREWEWEGEWEMKLWTNWTRLLSLCQLSL